MSGYDHQADHDQLGADGWAPVEDRLAKLHRDVVGGLPPRPDGGARSARRRGLRRRVTRLVGTAAAVAAVVVAVPIALVLGDNVSVDRGLQVATQPPTGPSPSVTPPRATVAVTTPSPRSSAPPGIATAASGSATMAGTPGSAVAPTGAVEVEGPPVGDQDALAAAEATELPPSDPDPALAGVGFVSPSGGIVCGMGTEGLEVHCRVAEAEWSVARPAWCGTGEAADWESMAVSLDAEGSRFGRCATDSVLVVDPPVLGYGNAVVVGNVRCSSLTTGVTCQDTVDGSGFRVSRSAALIW